MKILKMPAYCYPENVATSHLDADLFKAFKETEIETIIHTSTPTRGIDQPTYEKFKKIKYEELYDGSVKINRFSMVREKRSPVIRALRYILSNLIQYRKGIKEKNIDVVFGGSTPPTQGMLCAKVAKKLSKKYGRKVPFVYNLQDVFPDSLVTTGLAKKDGFLWKIGRRIEDYTYRNADAIIVISEDMKSNIMAKGVAEEKIYVVSNWIDTDEVKPVSKESNKLYDELELNKDSFKVVYAGNLGKAQGVSTALDTAELLKDEKNIEFIIFGKGAEEEEIKKRAQLLENVKVFPLMPPERIPEVYSLGDVSLVMCKKGTGGAGVPSKTWSILACQTPIIVSFDEHSELSNFITKEDCGYCVPPEDAQQLAKAVMTAYTEKESLKQKGINGYNYVVENASAKVCPQKYVDAIKAFATK